MIRSKPYMRVTFAEAAETLLSRLTGEDRELLELILGYHRRLLEQPEPGSLRAFRGRYPWCRPYERCQHRDGRILEVTSYPYPSDETDEWESLDVLVKARIPDDPTTCDTYRISGDDPDLLPLPATDTVDSSDSNPAKD